MLGRVAPIEGAAVAVNDQALLATLVRRNDESLPALLQRLDEALGKAMHEGIITNEINGGRFRLAPHTSGKVANADPARRCGPV